MKIEYQMKTDDLLSYNMFSLQRNGAIKQRIKINQILASVIFLFVAAFFHFLEAHIVWELTYVVIGILCLLFYPSLAIWRYRRFYRKSIARDMQHILDTPASIEIQDECLFSQTQGLKSRIDYSEFESLVQLDTCYLFILKHKVALVIPKNQIDEQKLEAFIDKFEEKSGLTRELVTK